MKDALKQHKENVSVNRLPATPEQLAALARKHPAKVQHAKR